MCVCVAGLKTMQQTCFTSTLSLPCSIWHVMLRLTSLLLPKAYHNRASKDHFYPFLSNICSVLQVHQGLVPISSGQMGQPWSACLPRILRVALTHEVAMIWAAKNQRYWEGWRCSSPPALVVLHCWNQTSLLQGPTVTSTNNRLMTLNNGFH